MAGPGIYVQVDPASAAFPISGAGTPDVLDEAAFTAAVSSYKTTGGVFNDSIAALTSGQGGAQRLTANRAAHCNLRNVAGSEIGILGSPLIQAPDVGQRVTYCSAPFFGCTGSITVLWQLQGSATKTIRIRRVQISGTQTAAGFAPVSLRKATTAGSGGTSASPAATPMDTADPAATAVITRWTVAGTSGTSGGDIRHANLWLPTTAAGPAEQLIFEFGAAFARAPVLRGTAEFFTIDLLGSTLTGNAFKISVEWTEE